jgi:hypothetical protein
LKHFVGRAAATLPGVSEVKAFARQAVENVVVQSRDLLEQRTGEMKVLILFGFPIKNQWLMIIKKPGGNIWKTRWEHYVDHHG